MRNKRLMITMVPLDGFLKLLDLVAERYPDFTWNSTPIKKRQYTTASFDEDGVVYVIDNNLGYDTGNYLTPPEWMEEYDLTPVHYQTVMNFLEGFNNS
jgi:hypothetical protein